MQPLPANTLVAYTDGSTYRNNPGPVSWAVVFVRDGVVCRVEHGALSHGTNNRAELLAVIWALERETTEDLVIRSDSLYVVNCATQRWQRRANLDLWERFERAYAYRTRRGLATTFEHVHGHQADPYNIFVDEEARRAGEAAASCLPGRTEPATSLPS